MRNAGLISIVNSTDNLVLARELFRERECDFSQEAGEKYYEELIQILLKLKLIDINVNGQFSCLRKVHNISHRRLSWYTSYIKMGQVLFPDDY